MKLLKLFTAVCLSYFLMSCAGKSSSKEDKGSNEISNSVNNDGGSGSGLYYEMTSATSSKQMNIKMLIKMFLSPDGNVRTEMTTAGIPGKQDNTPMVLIGKASNTRQSTLIDDATKTFTINQIDPSDITSDDQLTSSAEKVDDEKIGDYNCVHARIISTRKMGPLGNMVDTFDVWKSNDVPILPSYKNWMDEFEKKTGSGMYSLETVKQLQQMGCTGFLVKLLMNSKSSNMIMQLTKVEHRDFPQSLFEVPAGYKEEKNE